MPMNKNRFLLLTALVSTRASAWTHELTCDMSRGDKLVRTETAERFVENIGGILREIQAECRGGTVLAEQTGEKEG